jgi:hypothetical protein
MRTVHLLVCFAALLSGGCVSLPRDVAAELKPSSPRANDHFRRLRTFVGEAVPAARATDETLDVEGVRFVSGQLVAGDSGAADSLLLSLMGEQYTGFVHAGILSIEAGKAFVYEGFATIRPHLSGPPTAAMQGRIRRVTLARFVNRQRAAAIYDPPAAVNKLEVVRFARARHADKTPFDPYFDWRDHSRLYCTEFAALALHAGGAPLPTPVPVRENPSLRAALTWLRVTADDIVTVASLTHASTRTAVMSRHWERREIDAHTDAKHELHRRFTADQRLGYVWSWSPLGLRLRPQIAEFLATSRKRTSESPAAIALAMFGAAAPVLAETQQ